MSKYTSRVLARIEQFARDAIEELAQEQGVSVSFKVRQYIYEGLKNEQRKQ